METKVRCRKTRQRLSAYLDGEIPRELRKRIADHLESCPECRQAADRLQKLGPILQGIPVPTIPERLSERVLILAKKRLERRRPTQAWLWFTFRWWTSENAGMRAAAAVVLFTGLAAGAFLGWNTWQGSADTLVSPSTRNVDVEAFYNLDMLGSTPAGSIEQAYLTTISQPFREEE
jgi:anti-sigma factor (TIGR02949 family)